MKKPSQAARKNIDSGAAEPRMKKYNLPLPDRLAAQKQEIMEFLAACHYEDEIFSAGACARVLNVKKHDFQTEILGKFGIDYIN